MYNSIVHDHLCDTRLPTFETRKFFRLFNHHSAVDVKKTISIALNFDFDILTIFILGNAGVVQCMDATYFQNGIGISKFHRK